MGFSDTKSEHFISKNKKQSLHHVITRWIALKGGSIRCGSTVSTVSSL